MEATQAKSQLTAAKARAALAGIRPGPTTRYPAPATLGAGVSASSAKGWVVPGAGGTYTLLGDGWDVYAASDNCVFACLPITATEGEWSCRITAVTNRT